jgi:hypothetical protein
MSDKPEVVAYQVIGKKKGISHVYNFVYTNIHSANDSAHDWGKNGYSAEIFNLIRLSDLAADKARIAELESDLGTLTKAAKELRAATPLLHCELFHHKRLDQHEMDEECPPFERWCVAAMAVTEALAQNELSREA